MYHSIGELVVDQLKLSIVTALHWLHTTST